MKLSPRQTEIALLVVRGLSNKAIARELKTHDRETGKERPLSPRSVAVYVERIARRLPGEGKPRIKILRWWYEAQRPAA